MTSPISIDQRRIVVALDLAEYSEIVLQHAFDQAAGHHHPEFHMLHVTESADAAAVSHGKQRLAALARDGLANFDASNWRVRLHVRHGDPVDEIVALAADVRAHMIVIGRFRLHHARVHSRSISSRVVDVAPCAALVVGLTDQASDAQVQCPECVEIRAASNGERWFCARHSDADRERLTTLVPSTFGTGGTLMW